ncbi:leucine-rich repeat and WD repeat-containing protein 1 [Aulostomus maculatus]
MVKITEKLLLERGSPKTSKLEEIKTLNLSRAGLKHQDLPVKLLSRLQALEKWDLSGNRLQEFPRNLRLPRLLHLDLSDNQMEDVTTLEVLSSLEELKMEDNLYITVSDNYKLMVLLPHLKMYNGKDMTSTANHLRYVYTQNLRTRIIAVWERNFSLPDPVTADKMAALEEDFVSTACQQVKFGPSSVSDFTKWKVEIMAREYLHALTEPKEETASEDLTDAKENCEVTTPSKRKRTASVMDAAIRLTPRKRVRSELPASTADDSPRKSSRQTSSIRLSPIQRDRKTPRSASKLKQAREDRAQARQGEAVGAKDVRTKEPQTNVDVLLGVKNCSNTQPVSLKPAHVLQCHSKGDSLEDFSTQLWACAFQPLPDSTGGGGGSRLVATCGGDSLCFIDCETGMVMKKYKVPEEEFFSLAWSTVLMSRGGGASAQHCSILAAGGKRGLVKLIHPRNNVAYGEFRASRKALSVLRFNHHSGNFLFTGSYDNKIVMWDIGGVDSQYNFKVVQLLVLESSATPLHLCLPPTSPGTHLLAACEEGLLCYDTRLGSNTSMKRSKELEITFPIYKKEDKDHKYHTIDGLSFLTDDIIASKNVLHGSIYLWSWTRTRAKRPGSSKTVGAVVLAELQWANTEIPYLALNTCPGQAYIACGDDRGRLWTYHITELQKDSFQAGRPIEPTQVLEWPGPVRKGGGQVEGPSINSLAMDPDLHYLVALSDKNMVMVWKREESL